MLNKKYGKFKLWQLIALGAAIGLAVYLYRRNTAGGEYGEPGASFAGTGTGAFGPINPDSGIPYAFEGSENNGAGLDQFLDQIQQMKDAGLWGTEQEPSVIETNTETIVQEPGEAQPLAQTKGGKPKKTGSAASKAHSHKAPKHPKQRIGVGPGRALPPRKGKAKAKPKKQRQPKPKRQRQPKQHKPKRKQKARR